METIPFFFFLKPILFWKQIILLFIFRMLASMCLACCFTLLGIISYFSPLFLFIKRSCECDCGPWGAVACDKGLISHEIVKGKWVQQGMVQGTFSQQTYGSRYLRRTDIRWNRIYKKSLSDNIASFNRNTILLTDRARLLWKQSLTRFILHFREVHYVCWTYVPVEQYVCWTVCLLNSMSVEQYVHWTVCLLNIR